MVFFTPFLAVN